jgi:rod shape-determining protein MreC
VVFVIFAAVMITLWAREGESGPLHSIRAGAMAVKAPMEQAGSLLSVPLRGLGNATADATAPAASLTELQAKNDELTAMVARLEEARLENERLTALNGLVDAYKLESTTARILAHSADAWNQVITIDKGTSDGIAVGMPVMSANGLIGQVEVAGPFTSTVRLLTDPASGVAVFLQANRSEGIVTGSSERLLYLSYMSVDINVQAGDVLITSGAGGVYPKGIVIGEVVSVTHNASDVYLTILVKPVSRVDSYEEVAVLTGRQTEVATPTLGGKS